MRRVKDAVAVSGAVDILDVLSGVPRATLRRISEDTGRDIAGLYRNLNLLITRKLVEEAGEIVVYGTKRRAMTYRMHPRVRKEP